MDNCQVKQGLIGKWGRQLHDPAIHNFGLLIFFGYGIHITEIKKCVRQLGCQLGDLFISLNRFAIILARDMDISQSGKQ